MPSDAEIQRMLAAWVKRQSYATVERAYLGEALGGGRYNFVGLKPGRTRARMVRGADKSESVVAVIDVINHKVPRNPNLRVLIDTNKDGEWEVLGPDGTQALESGGDAAGLIGVGPHSHRIGFGLEDPVEARRFEPGLVRVDEGMLVRVEPFFYNDNGTDKYWSGGTLDLTAYKPATTAYWGWVRVGLDPSTNTLTAAAGTEYADVASLTVADLIAIDLGSGVFPLAGVRLKESMTSIGAESLFTDQRQFIGGGGGGSLSAIVVACGDVVTAGGEVVWA